MAEWLTKNMKSGSRIAVDANLITYSEWRRINKEIKYKGINLVPLDTNLIDRMWSDRPAIPSNPVKPLNIKFTGTKDYYYGYHFIFNQKKIVIVINNYLLFLGKKCSEKVEEVRQKMTEKNATILLLTALDEIACKCEYYTNVFVIRLIITLKV